MNEQNRLRLERIAARHAKRTAEGAREPAVEIRDDGDDAAFLSAFDRARDDVLRPVMAEVGVQLRAAGYLFRIISGGDATSPSIDFHVIIEGRGDSKDTIRFFARKDAERGWQVIGELELKRSPVELTRFETIEEMMQDAVEQLVIDGVEQMFSSTGAALRSRSPSPVPEPIGASLVLAAALAPEPVDAAPPRAPAASQVALEPRPAITETAHAPEPEPPVETAVPTYLAGASLAGPSWSTVAGSAATDLRGTVDAIELPLAPALPFVPAFGAPLSLLGPGEPVARKRPPNPLGATVDGPDVPTGPALPFLASAGEAAQGAPPRADATLSPRARYEPAPPRPAREKPSAAAALGAGLPSRAASPWAADIAGTFVGGVVPVGALLPFDPSAPPSLPAQDLDAVPANLRSLVNLGGTQDAPPASSSPALPFEQPPAPPPPCGLTLQQYASLSVELAIEQDAQEKVLDRYRISAAERVQLDKYWRKRMADEPSTWMAWDRAFKAYKGWYVAHRRGSAED